uniref:Protein kinase domain-containing protein n=1 Tax=Panagrolaimus davidi TaxID=227884 RepID=A0A914QT40_9BILA
MTRNNNKNKILIITICGGIIVGIVVVLISLFFFHRRRRQQQKKMEEIRLSHQNPSNIDEWELTWDKLMIKGEELGSGAFGQVLQGKLLGLEKTKTAKLIEEKEDVAIKILQRYTNELSEKNFLNEIQMMKQINGHKNIVKMIGCITVGDRICLVLEFCSYRDLLQYSKTKQTELLTFLETADRLKEEFLVFAWEISQGMISDFGLSVQINDKHKNSPTNNILQIETGKLPVKWLAIESLKNYEFSLQSDIWAFGIVLFEMYSFGEMPFSKIENSQLLKHLENGNRLEKPELCPNEM